MNPSGRGAMPEAARPAHRAFDDARFRRCPLIGILRGLGRAETLQALGVARAAGLGNVEITMDTPGAADLLREAVARHGTAMNLGAGTVTTLERLWRAVDAGAGFVVTPAFLRPVVEAAGAAGLAVFPGAMSPTEIHQAWEAGATMVKVFPAEGLGIRFLRAVKTELPWVSLLPTGGVDLKSVPAFLEAGADGFGVGAPLFRRDRLEAGDWGWVESQCRLWVEAVARAV